MFVLLFMVSFPAGAQAATYYISPTGSNGNPGTSSLSPFLTFAYAINNARAWCGDTLILLDGTYGDGTSTGKISLTSVVCTLNDELTIQAANQRQAKIVDNGTGQGVAGSSSAYIIIDGLYVRSTDNAASTTSGNGTPLRIEHSNHITVRNSIFRNPNRYANSHVISFPFSTDILIEDNEAYIYHRHCVSAGTSERVIVRRIYCNPRGGAIAGGFGAGNGLGRADALMSFYPCKDCILENSIMDGVTTGGYLAEMNANYANSIAMIRGKVLGSILYNGTYGNGIFPSSRPGTADLNHTPQSITIKDVALIDFRSPSQGIKCQDCVGATVDHVTILGAGGATGSGIQAFDSSQGATPAQNSITITNILVRDMTATPTNPIGASVTGYDTWSGDEIIAYNNDVSVSPAVPANWTNISTTDPGIGTCKLWIPAGAAAKGAGTGGSDIGATILYRYINGVLTTTPLWDPVTGAFPHGAADPDGTNQVAGESLFDFHTRANVNANGCPFPAGYGSSTPTNPSNVVATDNASGAHIHVVNSGMDSLTVAVMVRWDGYLSSATADVTAITSSCGTQDIPGIVASWGTPAGDRTMRVFGKISPNSGTCTLTPTFSSVNVSGWVMISVTEDNVTSYADTSASSALSASPASTVAANPTDRILGFVATSNVPTLAAGEHQILWTDKVHPSVSIRGALSWQSGADGGNITHVLGSSVGWIAQNVALSSGGGGSGSTFRVSRYRVDGLLGVTGDPEVTLGALAAQDTAAAIGLAGAYRLRVEIIVETASSTPTGTSLYCRKNGGAYGRINNTFGSNVVRFYGPGTDSNLPAHGTSTTQRFSGTFQAGKVFHDDSSSMTLPSIPANTRTEVDYLLVQGNGITPNDVTECEIRTDSGATLGTHTVLPTVSAVTESAAMGF
jgi:hypothetical protein